jgi:hypothetical protein
MAIIIFFFFFFFRFFFFFFAAESGKKREKSTTKTKVLDDPAFPAGRPGRGEPVSVIKSKIHAVEAEKSLENFFRQAKMCRRTKIRDGKARFEKKTRQQDRNNGLEMVLQAGRAISSKNYTMHPRRTRATLPELEGYFEKSLTRLSFLGGKHQMGLPA